MAETEQIHRIGDHRLDYFRRFVNEDKSGLDYDAIAAVGFNEQQIANIKLGVEQAGWFEEEEEEAEPQPQAVTKGKKGK